MERETDLYKLRTVTAAQYRVLSAAGGYERKSTCLERQMPDGRMEFVIPQSEHDRMERLVLEVEAECSNVFETLMEQPMHDIAPSPVPDDRIPTADKNHWSRLGLDKPPVEHENNRPRESGLIDFSGLFNR